MFPQPVLIATQHHPKVKSTSQAKESSRVGFALFPYLEMVYSNGKRRLNWWCVLCQDHKGQCIDHSLLIGCA